MFDWSFAYLCVKRTASDDENYRRVRDALAVDFTRLVLRDQLLRHQAKEKFPRLDIAGSIAAYGYLLADRVLARGCEEPTHE